jgi:uncharacterized protein
MSNFDLKVGFSCNHNCVHCVVSNSAKYGDLSFNIIEQIIENIPKENSITITGGEPTIRSNFIKIVDLCKNHSRISVQTNGTGLTDEICKKLINYSISILLTIHSSNKDIYNKVARCPEDSFDKAILAAKYLTKYNITFVWQIVVHKLNINTVFETFLFAKSINKNVKLKLTYPDPGGNADNKDLLCTYTELQSLVDKLIQEFKNDITFEGFPLCLLQKHKILYTYKQHEESIGVNFSKNLHIEKYNMSNRRIYIKVCDDCLYKNKCNGIYKKYIKYFGSNEFKNINQNHYMYSSFFLWVFVTRHCNCTCEYCKQGKPSEYKDYMTEENFRYVLDECVKMHEKKYVDRFSLEISGGEPFLAFDMFKKVVPEYKEKYPNIFHFCSATNGTIINDEIIQWIKKYYNGGICFSIDDLKYSKPMNGISNSKLQLENIKHLQNNGIGVAVISVFDSQESMIPMAEFAINNFTHWRILLAKPTKHTKDEILNMAKPVLEYLYKHNKHNKWFDFDGWDLWNKKNVAGCPCGRKLLGIMPDLETIPGNGECIIPLGKFSSDLLGIIGNPNNTYYRTDCRPDICKNCEIKNECDGGCRASHPYPEKMKERCNALKELFEYVQTLRN